jgi:hypothetical protein
MQHLELEELARLVDEEPNAAEAAHLEACAACRAELAALIEQSSALAALPPLTPPAHEWAALEARLAGEGLLRERRSRARWRVVALQAAAALALFAGGAAAGARWQGEGEQPTAARGAGSAVRAVAHQESAAEAEQAVRAAEAAYLAALTRYAELSDAQPSADPATRLAALEGIVLTTRAALEQAPADPVINGYHLAALGQQQAILQELAETASDRRWY